MSFNICHSVVVTQGWRCQRLQDSQVICNTLLPRHITHKSCVLRVCSTCSLWLPGAGSFQACKMSKPSPTHWLHQALPLWAPLSLAKPPVKPWPNRQVLFTSAVLSTITSETLIPLCLARPPVRPWPNRQVLSYSLSSARPHSNASTSSARPFVKQRPNMQVLSYLQGSP